MTTIALPSRDLVLPQLHFPPFLRHLRDAKDAAVKRMMSPLGGILTPLAFSVTQTPWYLSGGISAANCAAAYQPKGAASLAASYVNLNNPGTNDAAPGVAPTLSSGWVFNGTTQYLRTGIIPAAAYSVIVRYSNLTNDGYLTGTQNSGAARFNLTPRPTTLGVNGWEYGSTSKSDSTGSTSGVIALAAATGYLNGAAIVTSIGTWSGTPLELYIGDRNVNGNPAVGSYGAVVVQAYAAYSITLSGVQVTALTTAMNAL